MAETIFMMAAGSWELTVSSSRKKEEFEWQRRLCDRRPAYNDWRVAKTWGLWNLPEPPAQEKVQNQAKRKERER